MPKVWLQSGISVVESTERDVRLHTEAECVVLLPVKSETHALPTAGIRPQAAINEQLVDRCDVLIGMFWTKIGTSTGAAVSGTVEEIDRFVAVGKPAMLYFSDRRISKARLNPKQSAKLKLFKAKTYKTAFVGSFMRRVRRNATEGEM